MTPATTPLAVSLLRGALGSPRKRPPYDGATLPTRQLTLPRARVDPRRLAAYVRVCGFQNRDNQSNRSNQDNGGNRGFGGRNEEGGGRPSDPLPATYPHILGFPLATRLMASPSFPLPLLGLVHTGIELTQHRALRRDDRPEIRVHAEGLAPHRRGTRFDMVTVALLDGEEVWSSRSTYLCRHRRPAADQRPPDGTVADPGTTPEDDPLPVHAQWDLPADLGRRYGAASGDRNPIHLHPLAARALGFPRALAHGMWTFARCLAALTETPGDPNGPAGPADPDSPDETANPKNLTDMPGLTAHGPLTATARFQTPVLLPTTVAFGERDGAFELRDARDQSRLHLSGTVSSGSPSSGSPGPTSRSS